MTPTLARFISEFGEQRGRDFYERGLTFLEGLNAAGGSAHRSLAQLRNINASKRDDVSTWTSAPRELTPGVRIVPNLSAPVGSREWAAGLKRTFSREKFLDYYERGLNIEEILTELEAEFAGRGRLVVPQ